jgi:non-heme chloroperoxidase
VASAAPPRSQASTIYHPVPQVFLDSVVAESRKLPVDVWKGALAGLIATENAGRLHAIQAPTLILWGDRDGIFPREEQDALAAASPARRWWSTPRRGTPCTGSARRSSPATWRSS